MQFSNDELITVRLALDLAIQKVKKDIPEKDWCFTSLKQLEEVLAKLKKVQRY